MNLTSGTKLGLYEILARLGAGGMGAVWEVYRARDARLKRDVAVQILPQVLSRRRLPTVLCARGPPRPLL